jgi:dihydrofolate reductase
MGQVIVVEFVTLDGVVEDPDGSAGLEQGGWAFHAGPDVFAGDKFALGPIMESGVLLLGRSTWEMFAERWPTRSGGFADAMNAATKVVVANQRPDLERWANSSLLDGDLVEEVAKMAVDRDVVVVGSISVAHQLVAADAVDEYRLLTIPIAVGEGGGAQLFTAPVALQLDAVESPIPGTVLAHYSRPR